MPGSLFMVFGRQTTCSIDVTIRLAVIWTICLRDLIRITYQIETRKAETLLTLTLSSMKLEPVKNQTQSLPIDLGFIGPMYGRLEMGKHAKIDLRRIVLKLFF